MTDANNNDQDNLLVKNEHGFSHVEYAGFWIRFGAAIIDILVMIPIIVLINVNQFNPKSLILLFILTIISALYKPLMEWKYGATLGKMACKIKVVNLEMGPITVDQSFTRYIPWAISVALQLMVATTLFLSPGFASVDTYMEIGQITQGSSANMISSIYSLIFILAVGWLIFDKRKQGLHDKMAKTFCVKIEK